MGLHLQYVQRGVQKENYLTIGFGRGESLPYRDINSVVA